MATSVELLRASIDPEIVFKLVQSGDWSLEDFIAWNKAVCEHNENIGWEMCEASNPPTIYGDD